MTTQCLMRNGNKSANCQAKSDGSLDYTELAARLRDNPIENEEAHAAAAALEAQARRIAGYQKDADDYLIRLDELNALRARIAELTAALKPFADGATLHDGFEPADEVYLDKKFTFRQLRAARAAYRGEKG